MTFQTHFELFEYLVLFFELMNVFVLFQSYIN